MPFLKVIIRLFLLLGFSSQLVSCLGAGSSSTPLKIAFVGSLSGSYADFGKRTLNGVQLAFDQKNKSSAELVVFDTSGNIEKATEVMKQVAADPSIVAVIGEVSSHMSLAIAPMSQKLKIPMITPTSTNPRVTEIGEYVFRICFIDPFQGYVMAKFARDHLKLSKVAVLKDRQSDYSSGLANFFTQTFQEMEGSIVIDEVYQSGDRDFKVQLNQIRKYQPEAIFIPGYYKEAALIIRQARKMGIKSTFLGGDGWDSQELFKLEKDAVNGSYFSNHFAIESQEPAAKEFQKLYREKFKKNPDGLSARGFDAGQIVLEALGKIKGGTVDRLSVKSELAKITDFPGATGKTSINAFRNANKPAVVLKVDGPVNRLVTSILPAGQE